MSYEISDGWFSSVNGFRVRKQPADMPHTSYGAGHPKGILWHYTAGCSDDIIGTLESNGYGGAAFNVGRDGLIHQYAPLDVATWHAREAGQYYVGIEHTTKGPGSECLLTDGQLEASAALSAAVVERTFDRHGFRIPLSKLDPPVELHHWQPGFLDHTDGPNAIEAGGADRTWNDAGHVDHLYRWSWDRYLGAVRSHLEDEMFEKWKLGWDRHEAGLTLNPDWDPAVRDGWRSRNKVLVQARDQMALEIGRAHV